MSYILVFSLVLQGFLLNYKILGVPVWSLVLLLFLPYVNRYSKYLLNLKNLSLKQVYNYFFILAVFLSVINLYTLSFKRTGMVLAGMLITTIIFYGYRSRINSFIKLIIIVILVQSVFSIMQFHFDLEFFDGFKRKAWVCEDYSKGFESSCRWSEWDKGSSGTFGFPVPYGYFMLTFFPIVYPFILSFLRRKRPLNNVFIGLLSLVGFYGLILSMQRGAIITVVASIFVVNMFVLKRKSNLIMLSMMVLLPIIFFSSSYIDKELFTWDLLLERLVNQYTWITQGDVIVSGNQNQKPSPHMYVYNMFTYYGLLGVFFILVFYAILLRVIIKHQKYSSGILPNGALIGCIMAVVSYLVNALFHNNGHFASDVVGFISIGYMFALVYFVSEKHYHSSYSKKNKNVFEF